jgi:hypothetical protein
MRCNRCNKEVSFVTMSIFNTQDICGNCLKKEESHPQFFKARETENQEVRNGNFNFKGIGLPSDLK